jgi:hypothetical protein
MRRVSSSNGADTTFRDGPFLLKQIEEIPPPKNPRKGMWRVSWPSGTMMFPDWKQALDWLDDGIAKSRIKNDAILMAGPYAVPWLLYWYLIAAEAAEINDREGVFDCYASNAKALLETDSNYREALKTPWVAERVQSAS